MTPFTDKQDEDDPGNKLNVKTEEVRTTKTIKYQLIGEVQNTWDERTLWPVMLINFSL